MTASDHLRREQFFEHMPGVDKLEDSPLWPVKMAFDNQTWSEAPVEDVPIASLHRTQSRVFKKYLGDKGKDRGPGREYPWVVKVSGHNWVADGHHRVVDAAMAGQTHISAYVRTQPDE
jgi:hypothetical protein